jgi:hypothetical protein
VQNIEIMGHRCYFFSLLLAVLAGVDTLLWSGHGGFFLCRATTTEEKRSWHAQRQDAKRAAQDDSNDHTYEQSSCRWTDDDNLNSCAAENFAVAWSEEKIAQTAIFWNLEESEITALRKLGQRLVDLNYYRNKPSFVIRFLLQRKSDVDAAELMFRKSVQWRLDNKVDSILQTYQPPPELLDVYPSAVMRGLDKDGDPIVVTRDGSLDGPALLQRFGHQALIRHAIWNHEMVWSGNWTRHYESQQGRPVRQLLVIDDMQGVRRHIKNIFNRQLMECFAQVVRLDNENYPHSVKKFVIVRVPRIFETIWSIVKHMLDPVAMEKVVFSSQKNYIEDLAHLVELKYLPEEIVPGIGRGEAREGFPQSFQAKSVNLAS